MWTVLSSSESELRSEEEEGILTRFVGVFAVVSSSEDELDLVGEGVRDF